jgi:PTS system fructose-specific IIC component/PTS system nitrogen regulatory IIA component
MLLQSLFSPKCIKIDIKAEDKTGVLCELVDFLVRVHNLNNKEDILDKIFKREEKMSTGLKKGYAFPHGKLEIISCCYGVLGISKKGIDFQALNGEPVHIFFLLVDSVFDVVEHLLVLKRIARLVEIPALYGELLNVQTACEAHEIISKFEGSQ